MNHQADVAYDYYEFSVRFLCPNCRRQIHFNEQTQPVTCDCGNEYWIRLMPMGNDKNGNQWEIEY